MMEGYALEFSEIVKTFTTAVENNDGKALPSLFSTAVVKVFTISLNSKA